MLKNAATTIDEFIAAYPPAVQDKLRKLRDTIRKAAPAAAEAIKYGIPTFVLNGNLVHFAGYEHHIGFYPAPSGILEFRKELAAYESAKGSVRFPLDKPLPLSLVAQIVKFRVAENLAKKSKTKEMKNRALPSKVAKAAAKSASKATKKAKAKK
ncbi:MAG TPA: DUF1801 domain-containing protein [Chryseolinea sp.]|nr:DUF1801 domain-containing protein [Chryseolinea sp.]